MGPSLRAANIIARAQSTARALDKERRDIARDEYLRDLGRGDEEVLG